MSSWIAFQTKYLQYAGQSQQPLSATFTENGKGIILNRVPECLSTVSSRLNGVPHRLPHMQASVAGEDGWLSSWMGG
jgi:hypothetical protein